MPAKSLLSSLALAAVALAATAGIADARTAGFSTVVQCTSLSGNITYAPGLAKKAQPVNAIVTGTLAGCSQNGAPVAGSGSFFAQLAGSAVNAQANNEAGTFVINWPAASG